VLINEDTAKDMDSTFDGAPVYVHHVEDVDFSDPNLRMEADGWVLKSFYNKADGKHWAEFIVVSEKGIDAIVNKKWKLSNAYKPKELRAGGQWHGVDFAKEITQGEYEHLAIVPNPRYTESIVLTPEEFKSYNADKEIELSKLKNSKENTIMGKFTFFKKARLENSSDIETMSVTLPKSKKEISIEQLINDADAIEMKHDDDDMAKEHHHVMVGEHKMKVNDLVAKHLELKKMHDDCKNELEELKKKHDVGDGGDVDHKLEPEEPKKNDEVPAEVVKEKKNDEAGDDEEAKKKALELAAHEDKELKAKKNANFNKLKNAQHDARLQEVRIDLSEDKVARGVSRYGSK
jgi:hypothetical protein